MREDAGAPPKKAAEVWELLDETAFALGRTALAGKYALVPATLRARLKAAFEEGGAVNQAVLAETREAVVELRKTLRLSGYDLSMARCDLVFDGFHDDDVMGVFTRATLFIGRDGAFYWITGAENHVAQAALLRERLAKARHIEIAQRHYLWFAWSRTGLTLSGSATELPADYERLAAWASGDPLMFLSRIKGMR